MGRKPKLNKKYGKDYGVPFAFRLPTNDYDYLLETAKRRREELQTICRQAIKNYIVQTKEIEASYKD